MAKLPVTIPNTTVTVNGVVLTVWKNTFGMYLDYLGRIEKSRLDSESPTEKMSTAEQARLGFHRNVYPALSACTTAERQGTSIPSEADCIKIMTQDELEAWMNAVRTMNPKWLGTAETAPSETPKETLEKKE